VQDHSSAVDGLRLPNHDRLALSQTRRHRV